MPSRSRPSSPAQFEREKPYDQSTDQSEDEEDFVNASVTPRPSSRTSAASGGSRSRSKVHSSSSSESVDSEEERELQAELQDAAGTETGVVRGAPVETTRERVMRSVGKGSSQSAQRYASLADADLETGRKHHHRRKSSRSKKGRAYALGEPSEKQSVRTSTSSTFAKDEPEKKSKTKKIVAWTIGAVISLLVVAAIITAAVMLFKRKSGDSDESPSNSTSLNDHANSTSSSNSTSLDPDSSASSGLPVDGTGHESANASPTNTASFDDGKYHPSTPSSASAIDGHATLDEGESHASDDLVTPTGSVSSIVADHSTDSLLIDPLQTGQVTSAPATATTAQSYGVPAPVESASVDGAAVTDKVAMPEASPSPVSGGQWNPLSVENAPQSSQVPEGGTESAPLSNVNFGGGVGSATPSAAVSPQAEATPVIGNAGMNGQVTNGENAQNEPGVPQPSQASWNQGGGEPQAISPIDSTAPGPFTSGEFKVATHPESFQTFVDVPATYFESSGHYGSCGIAANNSDFVVAINNALWLNSTQGSDTARSPHCGAEVLLTSMKDGSTVNAWVTDRCAFCKTEGVGSIDLSKAAFSALAGGSTDAGSLNIVWGFTGNSSSYSGANSTIDSSSNSTLTDHVNGGNSTESANATAASEDSGWFWRRQTLI